MICLKLYQLGGSVVGEWDGTVVGAFLGLNPDGADFSHYFAENIYLQAHTNSE